MQKARREAQKSFTWDATVGPAIPADPNAGQPRKYSRNTLWLKTNDIKSV